MKAKIKPLIILIAIFAASFIAGIAAGCNIGESNAQDAANKKGMYSSVTYYANGGTFSEGALCYKTLVFEPGKPIYNIGEDTAPIGSSAISISRTNMVFKGWVKAELDENGNPTLLEMTEAGEVTNNVLPMLGNGTASIIGTDGKELNEQEKSFTAKIPENPDEWEYAFENSRPTLQRDEHLYLVATWEKDVMLDYVLVSEEEVTFSFPKADDPATEDIDESKENEDVVLSHGDVITSQSFGKSGVITLRPNNAPATVASSHSYIFLFWDEECTQPATSTYGTTIERPQDGVNKVIYAKYLPGKWTTLSTAQQAAAMFGSQSLGTNNYYLVDNITFTTQALSLKSTGTFNGTILGNGYTISNIKIGAPDTDRSRASINNGVKVSLFGNLGASAVIKDLTIENVSVYARLNYLGTGNVSAFVYALFSDFAEGATLENFSVEGYSLDINSPENTQIANIPFINDEYYDTTNWLYGGTSDEEFVKLYKNIISNAALTINNELIIG